MYPVALRRTLGALAVGTAALYCVGRIAASAGEPAGAARLGKQDVSVEIDDARGLAVTTVRQEFINSGGEARPGTCTLPISGEAAVLRFAVTAPAPRKGQRAEDLGSMEAAGHNLYHAVVRAVPAHGRARCEVVYAEPLARRGRRRKYVYPIPSPEHGGVPEGLQTRVHIQAHGRPEQVSSVPHAMTVARPAPHVAVLTYDSNRAPDGRDLVVDYELAPAAEETHSHLSVLTPADSMQDPYFLLTLPPPAALVHGESLRDQPADIVFCMDISGGTRGRKLNTIQEAVHDGLSDLSPRDRFAVVAYDDDTRPFRRALAPANRGAVAQALRFVNRLRPGAGSDPAAGLRAALAILGERRVPGRSAVIAMVVDHDHPADLAAAATALDLRRRHIRLAVFGALPDARLLSCRINGRQLKTGPAVTLSRAVATYGPAFTNATLDPGLLNASYTYPSPQKLPALPLSSPVMLFGRLNQAPPARGSLALTGMLEGKKQLLRTDYAWEALSPTSPVAALWASRRIRRLKQLAASGQDDAEVLADAQERVRAEGGLALAPGR